MGQQALDQRDPRRYPGVATHDNGPVPEHRRRGIHPVDSPARIAGRKAARDIPGPTPEIHRMAGVGERRETIMEHLEHAAVGLFKIRQGVCPSLIVFRH
jgi:hypothetical protein